MRALVLVKFASLQSREGYRRLKELKPVVESHIIYGRYDAAAVIQADNLEEIRTILLSEIQPIPGVVEILTCLIVEDEILAVE